MISSLPNISHGTTTVRRDPTQDQQEPDRVQGGQDGPEGQDGAPGQEEGGDIHLQEWRFPDSLLLEG